MYHKIHKINNYSSAFYVIIFLFSANISKNRFWNAEHLKSEYPELSSSDIISIVTALATLGKHIKL